MIEEKTVSIKNIVLASEGFLVFIWNWLYLVSAGDLYLLLLTLFILYIFRLNLNASFYLSINGVSFILHSSCDLLMLAYP